MADKAGKLARRLMRRIISYLSRRLADGAVFATSTLAVAAWRGPDGWAVHVEQVGVRFS